MKKSNSTSAIRRRIRVSTTRWDRVASWIGWFFGSWWVVLIHTVWFTVWFVYKLDVDLLTLIVSLEAIYLVTFLLMYSNQLAKRDDIRDEADLEADTYAAEQIKKVEQIVKEIRQDLKKGKK